ncbi:MAG: carbohydrate-binding domain-containing protein [Candidatus Fibromonas sp.]|jgi:hypothetical protein|nr:carbohydrate-binding domain-containing protein [Candidatus Fibromonas sp.]
MKLRLLFLLVFFVLLAFVSCTEGGGGGGCDDDDCPEPPGPGGNTGWTGWPFDNSGETLPPHECPSYDEAIEITYNNGAEAEASDPSVTKEGENVTVNLSGTTERHVVVNGTARNGSLKIYGGDSRVVLHLNGVNIKNNSGPAINVQKGKRVTVCLVSGKENYLDGTSATPQGQEQAKGAFFSEEKLYFTGNGSLDVKSRQGHAIVVDNDFELDNGKLTISESEGDGIHVNEKIEILGGVIKIASKGDAIQSEKLGSTIYPSVMISGGKILAKTTGIKSHGITSESPIHIENNAIIQISVLGNGSKGIKSTSDMEIKGGTIAIQVSGGRDQNSNADTSTAAGIKVGVNGDGSDAVKADLIIDGGDITIRSLGSNAKGINVSRNIDMSNGNVNVEADDDGIKVHGTLRMSGGSITAASRKSDPVDAGNTNKTGGTINGK